MDFMYSISSTRDNSMLIAQMHLADSVVSSSSCLPKRQTTNVWLLLNRKPPLLLLARKDCCDNASWLCW